MRLGVNLREADLSPFNAKRNQRPFRYLITSHAAFYSLSMIFYSLCYVYRLSLDFVTYIVTNCRFERILVFHATSAAAIWHES